MERLASLISLVLRKLALLTQCSNKTPDKTWCLLAPLTKYTKRFTQFAAWWLAWAALNYHYVVKTLIYEFIDLSFSEALLIFFAFWIYIVFILKIYPIQMLFPCIFLGIRHIQIYYPDYVQTFIDFIDVVDIKQRIFSYMSILLIFSI